MSPHRLRPLSVLRNLAGSTERHHRMRARLRATRLRYAWQWRGSRKRGQRPWILVGLIEHLSDVIAAEPIARYLRSVYPDAVLAWAVRAPYRELIDTHPCIDITLQVECFTEWMTLRDAAVFDHVHDLHLPGQGCPVCHTEQLALPHHRGITADNRYASGSLLEVVCTCGRLPTLHDGPLVYLTDEHRNRVDRLDLPPLFVAVHAQSHHASRNWNPEWWRRTAQILAADVDLVEVGSEPVIATAAGNVHNACGTLSILETAEVIRRASAFIGIDSGPAHLANAVGAFGIILLGPRRGRARYMPFSGAYADGSNARILYSEGSLYNLPIERVLEAIHDSLAFSPAAR